VNRSYPTVLALVLATTIYVLTIPLLGEIQRQRQVEEIGKIGEIPPAVVRALSFEFKGVVADFLMLRTMAFVGERIGANQEFIQDEWRYLHRLLTKITEIDRRFWDPYLFAETMLVWQAGMIEEGNQLLLKAAEHRPWDYQPYYFLGFNHFYFKKDAQRAAPYLRRAARIPGAPDYLQGLAARFSLYGNETAAGIIFLEDMLRQAANPTVSQYLAKRLQTLKIIYDLERKVAAFKIAHDRLPQSFQEMIVAGLLSEVPPDPYGGEFILLRNGRIYTTSELIGVKPLDKK